MTPPAPPVPRYGESSLAELLPSVLSALGLPGFADALGFEPARGACVVVIDGLGHEIVRDHPGEAPFLCSAAANGRVLTAGYPSTTSASLGSLGTGLTPAEHGLVGYTFLLPGLPRPMNSLRWELYGMGPPEDLTERIVPERFQPHPTLMERSEDAGLPITLIGPPEHEGSPLTRSILRGGRYEGAMTLQDLVTVAGGALASGERAAVYAYHPFLDTVGHLRGVDSDEWRSYLSQVDDAVRSIAERLPSEWVLVVTGDHGMVNLTDAQRVDVDDEPDLLAGVRILAGEPRARHVHAEPGAASEVLAAWREVLGDRMWIVPGEEAVAAGWFGAPMSPEVRSRVGDVVAAAHGPVGIVQRAVDPIAASLVGHHGSMTPAEQLVPCIEIRR